MNADGGALSFDAVIRNTDFNRQMAALEQRILGFSRNAVDSTTAVDDAFTKLAGTLAGVFSIQAASSFVQEIVRVRGEFQQLEVAFTTMLKSKEAADQLMKDAVKLAAVTPFGLQDVASGAKQLLAYGTAAGDITNTLTMLGNIASGVGSPLNDIVYLYGTLQTQGRAFSKDIQQFTGRGIPIIKELAAQFKVTEGEVMGLVEAGKVGFPEVQRAFQAMTSESGMFYNLMAEQSKTLTGQLANLEDAWDSMLNALGTSGEGAFSAIISSTTELIENYDKVLGILGTVITTYGVYRAAVMITAVAERAVAAAALEKAAAMSLARGITVSATVAQRALTVQEVLSAAAKRAAAGAQALLNKTMLANPYVLVASLVAVVAAQHYFLREKVLELKSATDLLNDAQKDNASTIAESEGEIKKYRDTLKNANIAESVRLEAYNKLKSIAPEIIGQLSYQEAKTKDLTVETYNYIAALRQRLQIESAQGAYVESLKQEDQAKKAVASAQEAMKDQTGFAAATKGASDLAKANQNLERAIDTRMQVERKLNNQMNADSKTAIQNRIRELEAEQKYFDRKGKAYKQNEEELAKLRESFRVSGVKEQVQRAEKELEILTKGTADYEKKLIEIKNLRKSIQQQEPEGPKRTEDFIKDEIKKYEDLRKNEDIHSAKYKEYTNRIKALNDELQSSRGKVSSAYKKEASEHRQILDSISKAEQEAFTKGLSRNKQEIREVQNKYNELRKIIANYNRTVPESKQIPGTVLTRIDRVEQKVTGDIQYRQETDRLKLVLEKQKSLYERYQADRVRIGEEAAKKLYGAEISIGLLDTSDTYLKKLEAERDKLIYRPSFTLTEPEQDWLKWINEQVAAEKETQRQKQVDLLASLQTYEEQRLSIINQYKEARKKIEGNDTLTDARKSSAITVLDQTKKTNLNRIDDEFVQQLPAYKQLIEGVEDLSDRAAARVIGNATEMLNRLREAGTISEDLAKDIEKKLKNALASKGAKLPEVLKRSQQELNLLADSIEFADGNFANLLRSASNLAGAIGDIKTKFAEFQKASSQKDALGSITAGLGIIGTAVSAAKSLASIFDNSDQRRAEREEYSRKQQIAELENVTKSMQRQLDLIEEIYGVERVKRYGESIQNIQRKISDQSSQIGKKLALTNDPVMNEYIDYYNRTGKVLQKGIKYIQDYNKFQDMLSKGSFKSISDQIGGFDDILSNKDRQNKLQELIDLGSLDEETKAAAQSILTLADQYTETINKLRAEVTGTSFESLRDGIVDAITSGAKDGGEAFEEAMKASIINTFKRKYIDDEMQKFYKQFADDSESGGGLDQSEVAALREQYAAIYNNAAAGLKELEKTTGINLSEGAKSPAALASNTIKSALTEDTASRALGIWNASYDIQKRQLEAMGAGNGMYQRQLEVLTQSLRFHEQTAFNTGRMVEEMISGSAQMRAAVSELQSINKNTGGMSSRGMGI